MKFPIVNVNHVPSDKSGLWVAASAATFEGNWILGFSP
jgi:hypothetical protein